MDFEQIGARIRDRRNELGMTQEQLAEKVNVSDVFIGAIERANSKASVETLVKLASVLNMNMDYLLLGTTVNNIDAHFADILKSLPKDRQKLYIELCEAIAIKLKK